MKSFVDYVQSVLGVKSFLQVENQQILNSASPSVLLVFDITPTLEQSELLAKILQAVDINESFVVKRLASEVEELRGAQFETIITFFSNNNFKFSPDIKCNNLIRIPTLNEMLHEPKFKKEAWVKLQKLKIKK